MSNRLRTFVVTILTFWCGSTCFADRSADEPLSIVGTRVVDLEGRIHRLGMEDGLKPLALVILDTGCPIANRYSPELNQFCEDARAKGVEFYGVLSDPLLTLKEAREFQQKFGLTFPIVWDSNGDLATRLKPTHFPESFVISQRDQVVYRGRIDNRFVSIGKLRNQITSHELKDAIVSVAEGNAPAVSYEPPIGCLFDAWKDELPEKITFNRHIAPIVYANCTTCHREGEVAPFALENYEQAKRRALMSGVVVEERLMPPWQAEPHFGHFRQERFLSDRQIQLISAWAEGDRLQGDADDQLAPPEFLTSDWRLGKPDLVLKMEEPFIVPATGKDIYRYFVISNPLEEDLVITATDFKPGDKTVVHHMNSFVDFAGRARRLDAKDEEPGFSVFGTGGFISYDGSGADQGYALGGWVPGMGPIQLPKDHGIYIPAGGEIVIEIHYHLSGKETTDQSELAFYFAKQPVSKYIDGTVIGTQNVSIEPGDKDYQRHFWMNVPTAIDLIDVLPHMHYIGKTARVVATLPDGEEVPLVNITDWDFRWQSLYTFRQPVRLPAGSRIDGWFSFDNSADNPFNPLPKPGKVGWGWETGDEMAEVWLAYVPVDMSRSDEIYTAAAQSWFRSGAPNEQPLDVDAIVKRLSQESLWTDAGEELLLQISSSGIEDELLKEIDQQIKQQPENALLQVSKAAVLSVQMWNESSTPKLNVLASRADSALDAALEIDKKSWDAQMTKAVFYADGGYRWYERQALTMFAELIRVQEGMDQKPHYAKAYIEYGKLQQKLGNNSEAKETYRRGLKRFPNNETLAEQLAGS
ncbi:MAG: redoxin domain-containing protein [Planctomycetota bacterium]